MGKANKTRGVEPIALMCSSEEAKVVREFLTKVGDKWSILVVVMLSKAPNARSRFSELKRAVRGISQRMLSTTLRTLERDGFITREIFPEVPPRVEYELTPLGKSLLEPMHLLVEWIGDHWPTIKKARERFDMTGKGITHG